LTLVAILNFLMKTNIYIYIMLRTTHVAFVPSFSFYLKVVCEKKIEM
jgi:hypothetical protein